MRLIKFLSMMLLGFGLLAVGGYSIYLYQNSKLFSREPLPERLSLANEAVQFEVDSSGFVHIKAFSERSTLVSQGYASAWKSLWVMDLLRRAALGRLSETFGQSTLPMDKFFRALRLDSLSKKLYRESDPASREWLDWYSEGVNLYIAQHRESLAPEFRYLHSDPIPWEPAHSLLIYRFLCLNAEVSWKEDLLFHRIEKSDNPVLLNPDTQQIVLKLLNGFIAFHKWWGKPEQFGQAYAFSWRNNGRGIMLSFRNPVFQTGSLSTWQLFQLSCRNFELAGVALPGVPGVFAGQNTHIAWGMMPLSDQGSRLIPIKIQSDKFAAENGRISGKFQLAKEHLIIENSMIPFLTRETRYGPLLVDETAEPNPTTGVLLSWNSWRASDEIYALRELARATSADSLTRAFREFKTPATQLVFFDLRRRVGSVHPAPRPGELESGEMLRESVAYVEGNTSILFTDLGRFRIVAGKPAENWTRSLFASENSTKSPGDTPRIPELGVIRELDQLIGEMVESWLPIVIKSYSNSPVDSLNENLPVLLREKTDVPELAEVRDSFLIAWRWFALRKYLGLNLPRNEHRSFMVQPDVYWSAYQHLSVSTDRGDGERAFLIPDSLVVDSYLSAIRYWEDHLGEHPYNWRLSTLRIKLGEKKPFSLIDVVGIKQSIFFAAKNFPEDQAVKEEMKLFLDALFNECRGRNFISIPQVMPIKLQMQVGVFDTYRNIYLPEEKKQHSY